MTDTAGPGTNVEAPGGESPPAAKLAGWMEDHGGELHRHLTRMLGRPDDAEDVLQEVWLAAHRSRPDDGSGTNVRAWLYRVATHAALDRLARERRRANLLDRRRGELDPGPAPPPDAGDGLGETAREEVRRRVAALPRRQREAVWLRWIQGEDYATVARKLECSRATARANVYQGLKRLREELSELWNEEMAG